MAPEGSERDYDYENAVNEGSGTYGYEETESDDCERKDRLV